MTGQPEIFSTSFAEDGFTGEPAELTVTADTIDAYTLIFEGRPCGRCDGTGRLPQFGHVLRGVCFTCNGNGAKYTKRGKAARTWFDSMCAQSLLVPRDEIHAGDRVWDRHRGFGAWALVTEAADDGKPGASKINGVEHPYPSTLRLQLDHPAGEFGDHSATGQGYTVARWDADRVAKIVNEIAAMPGARLAKVTAALP